MHDETPEVVLDMVIGRAIRDSEFRDKLLSNPLRAAEEEGYSLTEADRIGLQELDTQKARDFFATLSAEGGVTFMASTRYRCYEVESQPE